MLRLLVALDFSDCSRIALGAALSIVHRAPPAELVVMSVLERTAPDASGALDEIERCISGLHQFVERELKERHGGVLPSGVKLHFTAQRGSPAEEIVRGASVHHVDAIVLGTHGRTGLNRLLVGSVAETVVRTAPCTVVTVKPTRTT